MNLSIVVPCYNEEEVLTQTAVRLTKLVDGFVERGTVDPGSQIVFVDDGSSDRTWTMIEELVSSPGYVRGIKLSRNRGHQNALLAGLLTVDGDAVVSLDADLQDDIGVIEEMLEHFERGIDIVFGVRRVRKRDSWFKSLTARLFYRILGWANSDMISDHADFRLMSRRAIEELRKFGEVNLYLRGLIPMIGLPSEVVNYERGERTAGETKYPLRKMLSFAFDGISSFSALPLRAITVIGVVTFFGCLGITSWALVVRFFTDRAIPGWASTVLPIYSLGAIQILCLGVVGEYMAKIYSEVKARPRFSIESTVGPVKPSSTGPPGREKP